MSQPISKLAICRGNSVQHNCLVRVTCRVNWCCISVFSPARIGKAMESGYRFYYLCLWVSRGLGRAGLRAQPLPVASPTPGFVGRTVLGGGTVEMVLIQCLNSSFQVGMPVVSFC